MNLLGKIRTSSWRSLSRSTQEDSETNRACRLQCPVRPSGIGLRRGRDLEGEVVRRRRAASWVDCWCSWSVEVFGVDRSATEDRQVGWSRAWARLNSWDRRYLVGVFEASFVTNRGRWGFERATRTDRTPLQSSWCDSTWSLVRAGSWSLRSLTVRLQCNCGTCLKLSAWKTVTKSHM